MTDASHGRGEYPREPLSEQAEIRYGWTASAAHEGNVRMLRITDIQEGHVDWGSVPYCTVNDDQVEEFLLREGDIVFARTGGTTGKSYRIGEDVPSNAVFASYLIRVRPSERLDSRFLALFFQSSDYWDYIREQSRGIGQPNVNGKILGGLRVPVPPLAVQCALASLAEARLAELRAANADLDNAIAATRYMRNSLFALADDERHQRVPLGDLIERIEGGKSLQGHGRPASESEWGVIKVSAMTWGSFQTSENKALVDQSKADPRYEVQPGDLLFSRANTTRLVGASVLVPQLVRGQLLLSDKSLRLVPATGIDSKWLHAALNSPRVRAAISSMATGTSDSMRNISQTKLRSISMHLPPLEEQHSIVQVLDSQLEEVDELEADLLRARQVADFLERTIIDEAVRAPVHRESVSETRHERLELSYS